VAGVSCFTAWQCLQAALAARFECDLDEVQILEDDTGIERLWVLGCVIGYATTEIGGITFGFPDAPSIVPPDPPANPQTVPTHALEA
jgi:hypothetical protein